MQPPEEERSPAAPEPLRPQGGLPLPGLPAERGAEEEEGAAVPRPDRRLPVLFQGGLRLLDFRRRDALLALWSVAVDAVSCRNVGWMFE